ncbi:unnamed protein product, partial [Didymodactylos carnosus]
HVPITILLSIGIDWYWCIGGIGLEGIGFDSIGIGIELLP